MTRTLQLFTLQIKSVPWTL